MSRLEDHFRRSGTPYTKDQYGRLVVRLKDETRVYDVNEQGGYESKSGPTSVYIDKFGNT